LLYLTPVNFGFISFVRRKPTLSQAFFNKRYFASLTCVFYLRHSSNWNPHHLHSEPFPPKEKHNVGLLRFDDHDHICYRFAQVRIVFKNPSSDMNFLRIPSSSRNIHSRVFLSPISRVLDIWFVI
jgi:hypothetical protein